jgi:hypothetical protein
MLVSNTEVPNWFIAIVSSVISFYFGTQASKQTPNINEQPEITYATSGFMQPVEKEEEESK